MQSILIALTYKCFAKIIFSGNAIEVGWGSSEEQERYVMDKTTGDAQIL